MPRQPDPQRPVSQRWRIESRDPDEPDEIRNWYFIAETDLPDRAREILERVRNGKQARTHGLVIRARNIETHFFIEDW